MAAAFRIKQVFELRSRGILVIAVEILSGTIHVGDRISGLGRDVSVAAVEALLQSDRSSDVALGVDYADEEDLARLKGAAASGGEIAISSPASE